MAVPTYEQYAKHVATMRTSTGRVQPYTAEQWASLTDQHKALIGLTIR